MRPTWSDTERPPTGRLSVSDNQSNARISGRTEEFKDDNPGMCKELNCRLTTGIKRDYTTNH